MVLRRNRRRDQERQTEHRSAQRASHASQGARRCRNGSVTIELYHRHVDGPMSAELRC
jgi:hypothetical protein